MKPIHDKVGQKEKKKKKKKNKKEHLFCQKKDAWIYVNYSWAIVA